VDVDERMNQSFKNWLSVGAPLLIAGAALVALCVRTALGITWSEVILPAFLFGMIQVVFFGAMYFARTYARAHNDLRPGFLTSGLYCLAVGLLGIHYAVRWGLIGPKSIQANYGAFTIFVLVATVILMFLPLRLKL
jgi:hypothetical protein